MVCVSNGEVLASRARMVPLNFGEGEAYSLGSTPRPTTPPREWTGGWLRHTPLGGGGANAVGSLGRASHAAPAALPLDVPPPAHVPRSGVLLSSDACQSQFWIRGPVSTCGQSSGMPPSSTFPPPPHLNPWIRVKRPQVAFRKPDGRAPSETSTPVAGQLRCVLRSSGAVGRP